MRNAAAAFLTALANAPKDGLDVRRYLWVRAKSRAVTPVDFNVGLWTGDDDITISVVDGITGATVSRVYYGQGTSLQIPKIPRVSDLTIQTLDIKVSQLNPITQLLVRENNVRFAKVDIHEAIISPVTGLPVSMPEIAFLGEIDGDPIDTPEVGGDGSITLETVSDAIRSLTLTNPKRRSYVSQHERSNDDFGIYGNVTENMRLPWGEVTVGEAPPTPIKISGGYKK